MAKYQIDVDSSGNAREKYMCFGTILCRQGLEFCDQKRKTCVSCDDFYQDCFTNFQQKNCTKYCMDKWKEQYAEMFTVPALDLPWANSVTIAMTSLILFILLIVHGIKIRKWISTACSRALLKREKRNIAEGRSSENVRHRSANGRRYQPAATSDEEATVGIEDNEQINAPPTHTNTELDTNPKQIYQKSTTRHEEKLHLSSLLSSQENCRPDDSPAVMGSPIGDVKHNLVNDGAPGPEVVARTTDIRENQSPNAKIPVYHNVQQLRAGSNRITSETNSPQYPRPELSGRD